MLVREYHLRVGAREVVLLEGPEGWGESSPIAGYPCSPRAARAAAEEAACRGWPAPLRDAVAVNALVDADGPIDAARLREYPCVKVKVGRHGPADDIRRVSAVRDAIGPSVALRIDANGTWDVDVAATVLDRLAPFDIELVEQPVATLDELARLRKLVSIPVAADESIRGVDDARRARKLDAVDAIVLKVQPLGGVRPALDVADAAGVPAIVTSMMETSVGLAAGLALACALPELPYACGLATVDALDGDVVAHPLVAEHGMLWRRGVVPDPALLARYEVRS
ncbi:MAG: O-succinylbenzoate synthase [Actinobacteria bacterium]|nr:O-succinylbenzoate synthase [Actinomycetota bacterium]